VRRATTVIAVLTFIAAFAGLATGTGAATTTTTIAATADSYVVSAKPTTNFGTLTPLRVRNQSKMTYVRFAVPAPPSDQAISRATLQIYSGSTSLCPVEVLRAANDSWTETGITWKNQPGVTGTALASTSWTTTGYKSFDVTTVVTGGDVSFVLRHAAGCTATSDTTLRSREGTSNRPRLVVELSPATPQCSDGIDNDGDGLTDYPADPGCSSALDPDETDPPAMPAGTIHTVDAAGDIVCDPTSSSYLGNDPTKCQFRATESLLPGAEAVLELGDLQYSNGTLAKFTSAYDPSWGQYASDSYPAVGNHEYSDPAGGAQGYFSYWASKSRPTGDPGAGYYSFDIGTWHLVSLNSNCSIVACGPGSAQNTWLQNDLASTQQPCILAYWHHPLFNSGTGHGSDVPAGAVAFWNVLYPAHADLVLNGHEHNYQRYGKQDPTGVATTDGIREFVVGTGGASHYGMLATKDTNYEFGDTADFGALRLYLGDDGYSWEFVNQSGMTIDEGGPVACN